MTGINRVTGVALDGVAHLQQSIATILTTPIGSRVMRRDFGSRLFELIDAPSNRSTLVSIYAETAEALATWEPRYALQRVSADSPGPGAVTLHLLGVYKPRGTQMMLDVDVSTGNVRSTDTPSRSRLESIINGEYGLQRITEDERPDALGGLL